MRSKLLALVAAWRDQAERRERSAKAYKCRSMDGERSGLIKSALAFRQAAQELEDLLDAHAADQARDGKAS